MRVQAIPIEARVVLPAGEMVRRVVEFVPRKIIVDANGVQQIVPGDFDQWAFGTNSTNAAELRRRNMANQLQQRIGAIDAVCLLTPSQRSRLELAGRGDIARLFDALAQIKHEVEAAKEDFGRIEDLYRANSALRMSVMTGPFGEDSLLFKSVEPLLDPDQAARFESLRDLLGDQTQVVSGEKGLIDVHLRGAAFDDEHLSRIVRLGSPESPLRLRTLYLSQTRVTDAGLASIPASETLENLILNGTMIGDAGLKHLSRFPNLRQLNLNGLAITDRSLEEIGKLTHLSTLSLVNSQVSDKGIAHLRDLTELTSLTLQGNPIGDAALAHLEKLTRLQILMVTQTNVTDAGIANLRSLRQLRILYVGNSKVTPRGVAELKKSLPNLSTDIR